MSNHPPIKNPEQAATFRIDRGAWSTLVFIPNPDMGSKQELIAECFGSTRDRCDAVATEIMEAINFRNKMDMTPTQCGVVLAEAIKALKLIQHATSPSYYDGAHHENAHQIAEEFLTKYTTQP